MQRFYDEVVEKLRALPGVQAVTAISTAPVAGSAGTWVMSPDPAVKLSNGSASVQHDEVLPGFFETMGLTLLAGRTLTDEDRAGTPLVAVVNEVMARRFWPAESAVGKQFLAPNGGVRTIVGIVADIRERGLSRPPLATFYESVRQVRASQQVMLVRTAGDPMALAESARRAIWSVDPLLPVEQVTTMGQIVHESLAPERYRAALVAFFALLAATMTAIGIAGVAMRSVAAQLRELCIRMAIGATPQRVIRLVVGRYACLAVGGVVGGAVLSLAAMRLVAAYLVGVSTRDPVTFSVVAAMILAAAAVAAWLPARRIRSVSLTRELARM